MHDAVSNQFDQLYATLAGLPPVARWDRIMSSLDRPGGPPPPDVLGLLADRLLTLGIPLVAAVEALPVELRPAAGVAGLEVWGRATAVLSAVPASEVDRIRVVDRAMRAMRAALVEVAGRTGDVWTWPEEGR
ncbi:hypothetical protein [Streptomyces sp. NPDC048606]|uniref:hypothetical protein n=1 Tax=Streptomyces sp. NPDC048606 TaxID=3154726 RepID=UPI00343981C7